ATNPSAVLAFSSKHRRRHTRRISVRLRLGGRLWVETGPSPTRVAATGCVGFRPFASSRPGPQRFDPKAAIPACPPGDLLLCPRSRTHRPAPVLLCVIFVV